MCRKAEPDLLIKYIDKLRGFGELDKWTVALISNSDATATSWTISGREIGLIFRDDKTPDNNSLYMLKKSNILSPHDEKIDLSGDQIKAALSKNIAAWQLGEARSKNEPKTPSGPFIRKERSPQNGLLLIYPLDHKQFGKSFTSLPIIGFAISFPESATGTMSAIEYQVNTTYWRERYGEEYEDDA